MCHLRPGEPRSDGSQGSRVLGEGGKGCDLGAHTDQPTSSDSTWPLLHQKWNLPSLGGLLEIL